MPPKQKKEKKANLKGGYKMAELVDEGTVVVDYVKKEWKVGTSVGKGGFGLIYLTQPSSSSAVPSTANCVMKMEPKENGPLFTEIACFQRAFTQKKVTDYMKSKGISVLGVPKFHSMGIYKHHNHEYRFMVMQRLGRDLESIIKPTGTLTPSKTFSVASNVIDALEYLHTQGYSHADIKAGNLMTGYPSSDQIYLIDYGLASRFSVDGEHKKYEEDKRCAHNGTTLFTCSDAHKGACVSARGDLEILAYCMWHWMEGKLPWEGKVEDPAYVAGQKEIYMADIAGMVAPCITDADASKKLCNYMTMVTQLKYNQTPDYAAFKKVIHTSKSPNQRLTSPTKKTYTKSTPKCTKAPAKSPRAKPLPQLLSPIPTKKAVVTRPSRKAPMKVKEEVISPSPSRSRSRSKHSKNVSGVAKARGVRKNSGGNFLSPDRPVKNLPSPARTTRGVVAAPVQSSFHEKLNKLPLEARKAQQISVGVQTSPGLRGLRSRSKII